ncbi:unnamed protein product [Ectocarpus sp. CCAP 1310/34]|nr:unnamed protein product [Ectocarpus sp. CCAP 1310/34]
MTLDTSQTAFIHSSGDSPWVVSHDKTPLPFTSSTRTNALFLDVSCDPMFLMSVSTT